MACCRRERWYRAWRRHLSCRRCRIPWSAGTSQPTGYRRRCCSMKTKPLFSPIKVLKPSHPLVKWREIGTVSTLKGYLPPGSSQFFFFFTSLSLWGSVIWRNSKESHSCLYICLNTPSLLIWLKFRFTNEPILLIYTLRTLYLLRCIKKINYVV